MTTTPNPAEQTLRTRLADDIAALIATTRLAANRETVSICRALVLREVEGLSLAERIVRGTR